MTPIQGWHPDQYRGPSKYDYARKYDVPDYKINIRSNNTFHIDLGGAPRLSVGSYIGLKFIDVLSTLGLAFAFRGLGNNAKQSVNPLDKPTWASLQKGLNGIDSFSYANSRVAAPTTPTTEQPKKDVKPKELTAEEYAKLKAKDNPTDEEKAQMKAYEKAHPEVLKKDTVKPANDGPTLKDGVPSATDLNAFINDTSGQKVGKITGPGEYDVQGSNGVDNVKATSQDVDANGYLKNFTITDASGNIYALSNPELKDGVLTYQVKKQGSNLGNDDQKLKNGKINKNYEFNSQYDFDTRLPLTIVGGVLVLDNPSEQAIAKKQ